MPHPRRRSNGPADPDPGERSRAAPTRASHRAGAARSHPYVYLYGYGSAGAAAALARGTGLAAAPAARPASAGAEHDSVHHFGRGLLLGFGRGGIGHGPSSGHTAGRRTPVRRRRGRTARPTAHGHGTVPTPLHAHPGGRINGAHAQERMCGSRTPVERRWYAGGAPAGPLRALDRSRAGSPPSPTRPRPEPPPGSRPRAHPSPGRPRAWRPTPRGRRSARSSGPAA